MVEIIAGVADLHPQETVIGGTEDFCPRCVHIEGTGYPCATMRAIIQVVGDCEDEYWDQ